MLCFVGNLYACLVNLRKGRHSYMDRESERETSVNGNRVDHLLRRPVVGLAVKTSHSSCGDHPRDSNTSCLPKTLRLTSSMIVGRANSRISTAEPPECTLWQGTSLFQLVKHHDGSNTRSIKVTSLKVDSKQRLDPTPPQKYLLNSEIVAMASATLPTWPTSAGVCTIKLPPAIPFRLIGVAALIHAVAVPRLRWQHVPVKPRLTGRRGRRARQWAFCLDHFSQPPEWGEQLWNPPTWICSQKTPSNKEDNSLCTHACEEGMHGSDLRDSGLDSFPLKRASPTKASMCKLALPNRWPRYYLFCIAWTEPNQIWRTLMCPVESNWRGSPNVKNLESLLSMLNQTEPRKDISAKAIQYEPLSPVPSWTDLQRINRHAICGVVLLFLTSFLKAGGYLNHTPHATHWEVMVPPLHLGRDHPPSPLCLCRRDRLAQEHREHLYALTSRRFRNLLASWMLKLKASLKKGLDW